MTVGNAFELRDPLSRNISKEGRSACRPGPLNPTGLRPQWQRCAELTHLTLGRELVWVFVSLQVLTGQALLARLHRQVCRSRYLVKMSHSPRICALLAVCALLAHVGNAQTSAPAPAPGTVLESDAAAAAAYPISTQEELPLTDSATLPVTCNMTLIGLSATSTAAVSAAGRRLQASTNTSRGLGTADIHCVGSYNVTVTGGPALVDFVSGWTGTHCDVFEVSHPSIR